MYNIKRYNPTWPLNIKLIIKNIMYGITNLLEEDCVKIFNIHSSILYNTL